MPMLKTICAGAALALAAAAATPAWAGCGPEIKQKISYDPAAAGAFRPAAFTPGSIVGLWSVTFTDDNGNAVDFGYVAWHEDGTEIMNSGGRSPATENFCLGVYEQTGNRKYSLKHFALSYDPSSGALNAKVVIREDVTVDETGNNYSGPFTMTVDSPTGKRLQRITGTVSGQRLTADK